MKRFVIGDIHGNPTTLKQCLKKAKFDKEKDFLVCLGDVVDGYNGTPEVIEELMTIKNLVLIQGNHDVWFIEYFDTKIAQSIWTNQGGQATFNRYIGKPKLLKKHAEFLKTAIPYYELDNMLFVHGGIASETVPIEKQDIDVLQWDRSLYTEACKEERTARQRKRKAKSYGKWDTIFIGHTSTMFHLISGLQFGPHPMFVSNVINIDTGGGWHGCLTIMDIDTTEYWTSDFAKNTEWGRE